MRGLGASASGPSGRGAWFNAEAQPACTAAVTVTNIALIPAAAWHRVAPLQVAVGVGDIVVSPEPGGAREVDLAWSSPCGYVCLPNGFYVDDAHCQLQPASAGAGVGSTAGAAYNGSLLSSLGGRSGAGLDRGNASSTYRSCAQRVCSGKVPGIALISPGATLSEYLASQATEGSSSLAAGSAPSGANTSQPALEMSLRCTFGSTLHPSTTP